MIVNAVLKRYLAAQRLQTGDWPTLGIQELEQELQQNREEMQALNEQQTGNSEQRSKRVKVSRVNNDVRNLLKAFESYTAGRESAVEITSEDRRVKR